MRVRTHLLVPKGRLGLFWSLLESSLEARGTHRGVLPRSGRLTGPLEQAQTPDACRRANGLSLVSAPTGLALLVPAGLRQPGSVSLAPAAVETERFRGFERFYAESRRAGPVRGRTRVSGPRVAVG